MKKIFFSVLIIILIFFTTVIKNSTKNIEAKIFDLREDIRLLNEKYELVLLDHNFLSSPKKLLEYQKNYFENDLVYSDIQDFKNIYFYKKKIEIKGIIKVENNNEKE